MGDAELAQAIENTRQELYNLRFQAATGRLANNARLSIVHRDLARLMTVKRQREIWATYEAAEKED
jgi:large subunit ribosomal protein L29